MMYLMQSDAMKTRTSSKITAQFQTISTTRGWCNI